MVVLVNPHAGEVGNAFEDAQLVGLFPSMNALEQSGCILQRKNDESASGFQRVMCWVQPIPCPGLGALRERVVEDYRHVDLLGLVLSHSSLQRLLIVGNDSEALGGNAITLRRISVTSKGKTQFAFVMRSQDHTARYVFCQGLLKDPTVNDFYRE